MLWPATRTVLLIPAQACMPAASKEHRITRGVRGQGKILQPQLGQRHSPRSVAGVQDWVVVDVPYCASWSSRQGHWPATRFRHAGRELLPLAVHTNFVPMLMLGSNMCSGASAREGERPRGWPQSWPQTGNKLGVPEP
ncbi:hypothetical protein M440DRAFT_93477 [Trichoderma longibrachiatum ATCC 18648]|uniref:Uncharacterized protein n=1 Tax=Trichoderma longibrachiatum ATCC 18648 TaxID=983965 RepID=A0A2T4CJS2_TRILO|nr:hypothetical protein M440DRAFT_93477 [Trichoderma longibrachiatum ATCC 18648]